MKRRLVTFVVKIDGELTEFYTEDADFKYIDIYKVLNIFPLSLFQYICEKLLFSDVKKMLFVTSVTSGSLIKQHGTLVTFEVVDENTLHFSFYWNGPSVEVFSSQSQLSTTFRSPLDDMVFYRSRLFHQDGRFELLSISPNLEDVFGIKMEILKENPSAIWSILTSDSIEFYIECLFNRPVFSSFNWFGYGRNIQTGEEFPVLMMQRYFQTEITQEGSGVLIRLKDPIMHFGQIFRNFIDSCSYPLFLKFLDGRIQALNEPARALDSRIILKALETQSDVVRVQDCVYDLKVISLDWAQQCILLKMRRDPIETNSSSMMKINENFQILSFSKELVSYWSFLKEHLDLKDFLSRTLSPDDEVRFVYQIKELFLTEKDHIMDFSMSSSRGRLTLTLQFVYEHPLAVVIFNIKEIG